MSNTGHQSPFVKWGLFLLLSIIWGSSFILMKRGMFTADGSPTLNAFQVAAIRILSAGIVLIPVAIREWKKLDRSKLKPIFLSGFLGSFIPAFLFCLAETRINSSLAGFLNALTPIFTIIVGIVFYQSPVQQKKLLGVAIAFSGMLILFFAKSSLAGNSFSYSLLAVIATVCYGFNVNIAHKYLQGIPSLTTAAFAFGMLIVPSLLVLYATGYFALPLHEEKFMLSTLSSSVLGVMGTAVATVLFYVLLKRAGALFASMVTYGIPFIALLWGLADNESIVPLQLLGLTVILFGVYFSSRAK